MIAFNNIISSIQSGHAVVCLHAGKGVVSLLSFLKKSLAIQKQTGLRRPLDTVQMAHVELEIREQILKKVSQELHDNIGQLLTVVKLYLTSIQVKNQSTENAKVKKSINLVSNVIERMRNLSKTMDVDHLAACGLVSAVAFELDIISETGLISTTLCQDGNEISLEASVQTIVYHIIQESLNNSIKHAEASRIIVKFNFSNDSFAVEISDNGKGFDIKSAHNTNNVGIEGSGLRNIRMRSQLIGAEVEIISTPGSGTCVRLSLPKHSPN